MQRTILGARHTQMEAHKMQWFIKQRLNGPTSFSGKLGHYFTRHI